MINYDKLIDRFGISNTVWEYVKKIEKEITPFFNNIDEITEYNQLKVLSAMQKYKLSSIHFAATTGYGYNDLGRDTLEEVYADVFKAEAALVRPQIISGTHALTVALFGNLRPGDELLSPVGIPYDTLQGVIGIRPERGCLKEYGITYNQVDLIDNEFDYEGIKKAINSKTKMVTIQRSKGYEYRESFSVEKIGKLIAFIKNIKSDIICMVDNCYG
ncbi:MAG: methionine gamma-lyase family protein, partial [Anaerotignaceae bacterium]